MLALTDHVHGEGPPLLLLHGGTGSHRHWDRVVDLLARDFEVHAPDLPGFGQSPGVPSPADGDGDAYVALAAECLSTLVPDRGVHLVGFSFGGAVAAGVARAWQDRVARLSLIGPGGFGTPQRRDLDIRSFKAAERSDAARREVIRHNLAISMFADPATVDASAIDQQLWNIRHARFLSVTVSYQPRLLDDIAHIDRPLQLILGEQDAYAHPSPAARAARVLAARPDVRIDMVAGAGHWAQHEQPAVVARLLTDFHAPRAARLEDE